MLPTNDHAKPQRPFFSSTSSSSSSSTGNRPVPISWKGAKQRTFYAGTPHSHHQDGLLLRLNLRLRHFLEWFVHLTGSERLRRRFSWRRVALGVVALALFLYFLLRRKSTLALTEAQIERVWRWELASGHYPSRRPTARKLAALVNSPENPGVPSFGEGDAASLVGVGPPREYLPVSSHDPNKDRSSFISRPVPNSAIDLDVVMDDCDFSTGKYVRDCLSSLRLNAKMDQGHTLHRPVTPSSFLTSNSSSLSTSNPPTPSEHMELLNAERNMATLLASSDDTFSRLLSIRQRLTLASYSSTFTQPASSASTFSSREPIRHPSHPTADPACDPDHPRIFHIYWAGDFTDKPYAAVLSFLYTQNLGLDRPIGSPDPLVCRPQLWIWVNPGEAASRPDPEAEDKMRRTLGRNRWSAPLLHKRFGDVVKFRLWNTTEQLNAIPELEGWQDRSLFYSGGKILKPKKSKKKLAPLEVEQLSTVQIAKDDLFESRELPHSIADYDRLAVGLSDMVRFVLTFRYGGIYLDADTLFLRDWEELWGWRGAFAYRWSRLKLYNTAVLKMERGSALGSAIFKTAAKNFLDFHPMTMASYTKDAKMEELLLRLPDALFDPAWLNTENYQIDRPAFPQFHVWEDFFQSPKVHAGIPSAVGFQGFFRGAFSYHFHNNWWLPFDPSRDFADLGPRFDDLTLQTAPNPTKKDEGDLSWATVMKRTFEKFLRGEAPSAYGEWIDWSEAGEERRDSALDLNEPGEDTADW